MPSPDYARGAWISKKGSRVKHIGVIDRRQQAAPWRPLCNANDLHEIVLPVNRHDATGSSWFVDLNPTAWTGRTVCKNCIRVVEELNQMLQGTDANTERHVPAYGQGAFKSDESPHRATTSMLSPEEVTRKNVEALPADDPTFEWDPGWPPQSSEDM